MRRYIYMLLMLITVIIFAWFVDGRQLGSGEESLSVFNSMSITSQVSIWQTSGTGYPYPIYLTRAPLVLFSKILTIFNTPIFLQQAIFYHLAVTIGCVSIFFLFLELTPSKKFTIAFICAVFYFLNLYSQTQIFGRFLYASVFAWALIPLLLLLWIKWLNSKKIKFLITIGLSGTLFSLAFLQPAHFVAIWTAPVLWSVYIFFVKKGKIQTTKKSLLALSFFALFSIWWLYPYFGLSSQAFSTLTTPKANLDSLVSVSQYFTLKDILLLRQGYLLGPQSVFFDYYKQPIILAASIVIALIFLLGLLTNLKSKNRFLTYLLLIGWFVSKGANTPLGDIFYSFLFNNFSFLAVLRNPYEKFGFVYLLAYSLLFGLGILVLIDKMKRNLFRSLLIAFIGGSVILTTGPLITGRIMENKKIVVPSYYLDLNNWLAKQRGTVRVFHLPPSPGDSVIYDWGYRGVEPSEYLFANPSVSKIMRTQYFDDKYLETVKNYQSRISIDQDLRQLGISYLVVHYDIEKYASWVDYNIVSDFLERNKNISFVKRFGKLDVYSCCSTTDNDLFEIESGSYKEFNYKKISNRHYQVFLAKPDGAVKLIFKTTYSPNWFATINNKVVPEHELIYDYANVWEIRQNGKLLIDIKFKIWPWE